MAHFKQTFRVQSSLSEVWKLHEDPKTLIDLTPPPVRVKLLTLDQPLRAGAKLVFRLYLIEPFGVDWHAIYDEYVPYQPGQPTCHFVDRSLRSPFRFWVHQHTFRDVGDGSSTITDDATFSLFGGPVGAILTWIFAWPPIAFMFLYRRWKTRRLLVHASPTG